MLQEYFLGFLAVFSWPVKEKPRIIPLLNKEGILGVQVFGRNVVLVIMKGRLCPGSTCQTYGLSLGESP